MDNLKLLFKLAEKKNEVGGLIINNNIYVVCEGNSFETHIPVTIEKYGIIFHTHPLDNIDNWLIHSSEDIYESFRRFFSNKQKPYEELVVTKYNISRLIIKTDKIILFKSVKKIIDKIIIISTTQYKQLIDEFKEPIYDNMKYIIECNKLLKEFNMNFNKRFNVLVTEIFPSINVELKIEINKV